MLGRALWGSGNVPPPEKDELEAAHPTGTGTGVSSTGAGSSPDYVPGNDTGRETMADTAATGTAGHTGGASR